MRRLRTARLRHEAHELARRLTGGVTVRMTRWDTVEVSPTHGLRPRRYRLDDPQARRPVHAEVLRLDLPDAACLERLAGSCLLHGHVREVSLRIATMPTWLRGGLRPRGLARDTTAVSWRAVGSRLEVRLRWKSRRSVGDALDELCTTVLRPRRWEQTGGVVPTVDRTAWVRGSSTWPHGVLGDPPLDTSGPFPPLTTRTVEFRWPLVTALANPHGRRLVGTARRYSLRPDGDGVVLWTEAGDRVLSFHPRGSVEQTLVSPRWDKYAVVSLADDLPDTPFVDHVLAGLAACGVVMTSPSAAVRDRLAHRGHVVVDDPSTVDGPSGYQVSVAAARNAAIRHDPALRHTPLARLAAVGGTGSNGTGSNGEATPLSLPTVSVLIASKRPTDVMTCVRDLAAQTYPTFEVLLGTHGYTLDEATVADLRAHLPVPLRVVDVPADRTLGEVLGTLSRRADGELLAKVDDDDRYGPDHLTDLVVATRTSGADLVAKAARFVHLVGEGTTVDRTWAAVEAYDVTPAGGTMLLSRGVLQAAGGWSTSPRHVDADLLARVRSIGGTIYRTHGLGYVYVRHGGEHTWQADHAQLLDDGDVRYDGLPEAILTP
ncbi:glycosyltransferase family A protein [Thermasporomyces composti]|uniref:Glycosyl transferase family 2 n=1 Tax=Thermasporomyces composti TaxID=696763 RepID=A0A3D9V4B6_THECX|nr:glycosyltransferase family A protein [Thermasporomyces composti]REF36672.1 glycosyl transferase family 2 [Thermasporomyces composti]